MLLENVKIGNRLEIYLKREKGFGKSYVSQVEELLGANQVKIHMPISYGQLMKLPLSDNYSVMFFTEKGMVSFDASIIDYDEADGFKFIVIKITSLGERIQRREFFRFNCILQFKFNLEPDDDLNEENPQDTSEHQGIIKDIGGGGIRFVTNANLSEKDKVNCNIILDDRLLSPVGKVLHKQYFPKSNYKYQYRIQFTEIAQIDQEKIIQYIFNEQRRILLNGREGI